MHYKFFMLTILMIGTLTGQSPQIEKFYSTLGDNINSKPEVKFATLKVLLKLDTTFIEAHVELANFYVYSEKYRDITSAAKHINDVVELIKRGKKPTIKTNERYLLAACGKLYLDFYYMDVTRNTTWLDRSIEIFKLALEFPYALWADYNKNDPPIDSNDDIKNSISDAYENLGRLMMWSSNYSLAYFNFQAAYNYLVKTSDMGWKAYYLLKQAKISKVLFFNPDWEVLTLSPNDQLKDIEVITNENELYFYDKTSIKSTSEYSFKIWLMLVKIGDTESKTTTKYDSIKLLAEFDAKKEATRLLEFIEYDINGNALPKSKIHNPEQWTHLVPDSIFKSIFEKFRKILNK